MATKGYTTGYDWGKAVVEEYGQPSPMNWDELIQAVWNADISPDLPDVPQPERVQFEDDLYLGVFHAWFGGE